uniref:Uncharacterized protein n=1 Tax=viral metagenome TaxID=1070528 RepID=A0A6M3IM08_9ZZZZ
MSHKPKYIPGDYWMSCEICGFDYRASQMRKRWDGLWVCAKDFERRHPQDRIKTTRDRQRVPVASPDGKTDLYSTTLLGGVSAGAKTMNVADTSHIADGDSIGIALRSTTEAWGTSEVIQWTFVDGTPTAVTVILNDGLWEDAANGNTVYLSQDAGDTFIDPQDTQASDL